MYYAGKGKIQSLTIYQLIFKFLFWLKRIPSLISICNNYRIFSLSVFYLFSTHAHQKELSWPNHPRISKG